MIATREPAPDLPPRIARQLPGFTRYRVQVGTLRLHVMEKGEGFPVLLLHGNPTWGFLWRRIAAALEGFGARLVMPDLVGLGLSDRPARASWHTLQHHAEHIASLIDLLELHRFVFVGQDWGGPIGGVACAMRPGRMVGTVIGNTMLGPPREGFRPALFHRFAKLPVLSELAFRGLGFPQRALWSAQGDRQSIRGDVAYAYGWPLKGLSQNAAPLALARMVPDTLEHPSVPMLQKCRAYMGAFDGPAEIVWGDRDPVIGRAFKRVKEALPNARVTRTQAGHFLQEEVPEEFAAAIRRVVEAVR